MYASRLMLTVLGSGALLGTLAGLAVNPTMVAPPEPAWRQLTARDVPSQIAYRFIEAAPQDLAPRRWLASPAPVYIPADYPATEPEAGALSAETAPDAAMSDGRGLAVIRDAAAARDAAQDAREAMGPARASANPPEITPEPEPQSLPEQAPRIPLPLAIAPLAG